VQKYKAYFIVGAICLILGAGIGIGTIYKSINGNADARIESAKADFARDSATLKGRLDDAIGQAKIAQDASTSASRALADYRASVEARDSAREKRINGLIGQASGGGSGAVEISDGLDGDIELIGRIEGRFDQLIEGLQQLQKVK
jgi:hypothetical protein